MDDFEFLYKHGKIIDTVCDVFSVKRDVRMFVDSNEHMIDIPLVRNVVHLPGPRG
jgi:hypothetical protein